MLVLLSPSKTLDYKEMNCADKYTLPRFIDQSELLVDQLKNMTAEDLSVLMSISTKLGVLNYERYQDWSYKEDPIGHAKHAISAFKGDVYEGLNASTWDKKTEEYAQRHLRILSGLYGVLRPLDLMMPYRLEMGTKLVNSRGKNLYAFWSDILTAAMNQELKDIGTEVLVNLASNEYAKVLQTKDITARMVTPVFKDKKGDNYKVISFYAKKARGIMARYIMQYQIKDIEELKSFDGGGYLFRPDLCVSEENPIFVRG